MENPMQFLASSIVAILTVLSIIKLTLYVKFAVTEWQKRIEQKRLREAENLAKLYEKTAEAYAKMLTRNMPPKPLSKLDKLRNQEIGERKLGNIAAADLYAAKIKELENKS